MTKGGYPVIAVSKYPGGWRGDYKVGVYEKYPGGWYGIVEMDSNLPVYHKPICGKKMDHPSKY